MLINDLIFTIGSLAFLFALLPSLLYENKPETKTSAITATVLYSFMLNYIALGLYMSAVVVFFTAIGWTILYFQVKRRNKNASDFST